MEVPEVDQLVTSTLTERLQRMNQTDLPRLATMDRSALRVPAQAGAGHATRSRRPRRPDPGVSPAGTGRIGYTPTTIGVVGSSESS